MIETIFIALWICIFTLFCVALKRTLRKCRHHQLRSLRRFTRENLGSRRAHRQAA
jgi:hypothetical protein